ncbi:MAG: 30S ribosomal protein S6 [Sulfobacillus sp.]
MREYELALVIDASLDEEAVAALVAQMADLIAKQGGTCQAPKLWGKKPLAYPVDEKTEGSYVFLPFAAEAPALNEIYRVLRYNQQVLRHLVVHAVPESPEMAPRVVTRKAETFVPPGKLRQNAEQPVTVTTAARSDITLRSDTADAATPAAEVESATEEPAATVTTAKPKAQAKPKPAAKAKAEPTAKAEAKEKAVAKPKAQAKPKPAAKAKAEPTAKAEAKEKAPAKPKAAPKAKAAAKAPSKPRASRAKAAPGEAEPSAETPSHEDSPVADGD